MPPKSPEQLSRREREIMDAVFSLGNRASAEEIRGRLTDPPGYSAVRAMLVRLESKGQLRHREEGLRYIYSATTSPSTAKRSALQHYLGVFFGGSRGQLVTALLEDEAWSEEELDELEQTIARTRKERKQVRKRP
ncbi:MAG: BlaI/MecI/CopY family transcriptional regulator [Steroidobacteraceae bacterium]